MPMMRLSVSSRQQAEVTPLVPFKNKIQYVLHITKSNGPS
jgi:hypothetical protein